MKNVPSRGAAGVDGGFLRPVAELMAVMLADMERRRACPGALCGASTGFASLDSLTGGLRRGTLNVVASRRPEDAMAVALKAVESVALRAGKAVAMLSIDVPCETVVGRLAASVARIPWGVSGGLGLAEWRRLGEASDAIAQAGLFICDTPAMSLDEVRSHAQWWHLVRGGLGLIVLDDLQRVQVLGTNYNRAAQIGFVTRSLKALARELDVPILALSQLGASVERRPGKRPALTDLAESGSIEDDADLVVFVHRGERVQVQPLGGVAEFIVGKHRHGLTGAVEVAAIAGSEGFEDLPAGDG